MTILFLISSEGYYGIENMLVVLARQLSKQGCQCVIAVFQDARHPHTEVAEQAERHGLIVETVPCAGKCDWNAVAQIRALLDKHNVDVLHPHGYKADMYAYLASWPNRVALLATSHNWPSKLASMRLYAAMDRLLLKRFDKVIVVSEIVGGILQRWGVPAAKISTIGNGVEIERFSVASATLRGEIASADEPLVGFAGRMVHEKGGALLVRAAQQVLALHPKARFVFVGEGPARQEWESIANQLRIRDRVMFTGARGDMPGIYASLNMLVLPSLIEAQPMCLLEAMAAGKPVIATRVGAIPKLIQHGQTGILLERGDVAGLATAICQLLSDEDLARRLGERGRAHVARHFSAEIMATSYIVHYQTVLANRRRKASSLAAWEAS